MLINVYEKGSHPIGGISKSAKTTGRLKSILKTPRLQLLLFVGDSALMGSIGRS